MTLAAPRDGYGNALLKLSENQKVVGSEKTILIGLFALAYLNKIWFW